MEVKLKAFVVWLILNGKTDEALEQLSRYYNVDLPKIKVGLPKRHRKNIGCYSAGNQTISVVNSDMLKEPFIILHEFYHHIRTDADRRHRGTEKKADEFAKDFIGTYKSLSQE